jgi:hypothetical protein
MQKYTCYCRLIYIVGKKQVYGPIYPYAALDGEKLSGDQLKAARFMTVDEFIHGYSDCSADFYGK